MKHHGDIERADRVIRDGAEALGMDLTEPQRSKLVGHLACVLAAAGEFSLTTIREPEAAARAHVLDSLVALAYVIPEPPGPIVDIGSGAGFPGIPLGVASGRPVVLIESNRKKAAFLRAVTEDLGVNARVACARAEDLAREGAERAPVVVARAVASLPSLVELARPLLDPGGLFVAYKGAPEEDEIERSSQAAVRCGMGGAEVVPVCVPGLDAKRALVLYRALREPEIPLPRRAGLAQKRPLA